MSMGSDYLEDDLIANAGIDESNIHKQEVPKTLTPEQFEKCQKDFKAFIKSHGFREIDPADSEQIYIMRCAWMSAWRPIPSVEEIEAICLQDKFSMSLSQCSNLSQAIRRAFGGEK